MDEITEVQREAGWLTFEALMSYWPAIAIVLVVAAIAFAIFYPMVRRSDDALTRDPNSERAEQEALAELHRHAAERALRRQRTSR